LHVRERISQTEDCSQLLTIVIHLCGVAQTVTFPMQRNHHTAHCLLGILEECKWSESVLAAKAGLSRSVVSAHLAGKRLVRRTHLVRYLSGVANHHRPLLLLAWLSDGGFTTEVIKSLIEILNRG
jgi:hypothetical protein